MHLILAESIAKPRISLNPSPTVLLVAFPRNLSINIGRANTLNRSSATIQNNTLLERGDSYLQFPLFTSTTVLHSSLYELKRRDILI